MSFRLLEVDIEPNLLMLRQSLDDGVKLDVIYTTGIYKVILTSCKPFTFERPKDYRDFPDGTVYSPEWGKELTTVKGYLYRYEFLDDLSGRRYSVPYMLSPYSTLEELSEFYKLVEVGDTVTYDIVERWNQYTGETKSFIVTEEHMKNFRFMSVEDFNHHRFRVKATR